MLRKTFHGTNIFKIDAKAFELEIPPVLTLCENIGELIYFDEKGKWISCKNCKNGPKDLYKCVDPETGKQYVPLALKLLKSPYEKAQISLASILSKIVKPRNDKKKVWQHIQGEIRTLPKLDRNYFGM